MNNRRNTTLAPLALLLAWLFAVAATLITLYASQVAQLPVCTLCWYQRVCLYPLAIILGIACYRQDQRIYIYTLPLTLLATLIGLYQYLMQMIPGFGPLEVCSVGVDCSAIEWQWGFITFPFLSMVVSLIISVLLWLSGRASRN